MPRTIVKETNIAYSFYIQLRERDEMRMHSLIIVDVAVLANCVHAK
jgi:hypothetical protein